MINGMSLILGSKDETSVKALSWGRATSAAQDQILEACHTWHTPIRE